MDERLLKAITDLGITNELLKDTTEDQDATPIVSNYLLTKYQPLIEANPEWKTKKDNEWKTKNAELVKRNLSKEYGLNEDEIKSLDIKDIVKLGRDRDLIKINQGSDVKNEEIIKLTNKIQDYEKTIIPGIRTEMESALKQMKRDDVIKKKLADFKLNGNIDFISQGLITTLDKKYMLTLSDVGDILINDKQGEVIFAADKTRFKTVNEILNEELNAVGMLKVEIKTNTATTNIAENALNKQATTKSDTYKDVIGYNKALQHLEKMAKGYR
jgi:hypothetical protein